MSVQSKWQNYFREHKTLFVIIAVGLLLLELEIFAVAVLKSGRETHLHITDQQGNVLYIAKGNQLDDRARAAFEKTFGPVSDYQVNLVTKDRNFPFRAWLAAAVGMPIAGMLLFAFFVKAFEALFISRRENKAAPAGDQKPADRFSGIMERISRLNIFALGALVLLFVVSLYAVPFMIEELGRFSAETISKYKWVVIGVLAVFLGVVVWIIYLRYLLASKAIESQAEVEKFRIQIEMSGRPASMAQLSAPNTDSHAIEGPQETSAGEATDRAGQKNSFGHADITGENPDKGTARENEYDKDKNTRSESINLPHNSKSRNNS